MGRDKPQHPALAIFSAVDCGHRLASGMDVFVYGREKKSPIPENPA